MKQKSVTVVEMKQKSSPCTLRHCFQPRPTPSPSPPGPQAVQRHFNRRRTMPGLLDLPSELLFEIIDLVTNSPIRPPPGGKRYRPEQLHSRSLLCVPTTHPSWLEPTRSLLLSCKRLNAETSTYHATATQRLVLDVAIVDNHWIWPFFRVIPGPLGYVLESLDINLVYCCTEAERAAYSSVTPGWKYEEEIVNMIRRILRSGPLSLSTSSMGSRSNFRIKRSQRQRNAKRGSHTVPSRRQALALELRFFIFRRSPVLPETC
jgi:hypothetical protein